MKTMVGLIKWTFVWIVILVIGSTCFAGDWKSEDKEEKNIIKAEYSRWLSYKNNLRSDPSLVAYYDFEEGKGSTLTNKAVGPHGDTEYAPHELDGEISDSVWVDGRWPGKGALCSLQPIWPAEFTIPVPRPNLPTTSTIHAISGLGIALDRLTPCS